jgi:hypothetical protein
VSGPQEHRDPSVWNRFYGSIVDLITGESIDQRHGGLLPFRVWEIFDEMVRLASQGKAAEFVCAAGYSPTMSAMHASLCVSHTSTMGIHCGLMTEGNHWVRESTVLMKTVW